MTRRFSRPVLRALPSPVPINESLRTQASVDDHLPRFGDNDLIYGEIQDFFTGDRNDSPSEPILLTILMTDIVESTKKLATLGDRRWSALLDQHDEIVRELVSEFGGQTINTTGDGFITAFACPTRAIQCAEEIRTRVSHINIEIRAGVHIGECERRGSGISGLAVHIAARILRHASPGQILTSGTVKDITIGSGLDLQHVGTQSLKGVPGDWPLYAIRTSSLQLVDTIGN